MKDIMIREFGRYVLDERRSVLFYQAIAETVKSGDTVLDLGAGFGLLGLMAARVGARRVYSIEQGPYLDLARAIARDNGLEDRFVWINANSFQVVLPERVDVVVSEILGQFALEEFIVEYLYDARERFLRTGGTLIPQELSLHLTPVAVEGLSKYWDLVNETKWDNVCGFNLTQLGSTYLINEICPYVVATLDSADNLLGAPLEVVSLRLGKDRSATFSRTMYCKIYRDGFLNGLLGTFSATLSRSVKLSTSIDQPRTHWNQVIFPIVPPIYVRRGVSFAVHLEFNDGKWCCSIDRSCRSSTAPVGGCIPGSP